LTSRTESIDFKTPDSIRKELRLSQIKHRDRVWTFKIQYPRNFSPLRVHPVILVLSGGNASEKIVDYTYFSLFRGKSTNGFVKIFPLAPLGKSLNELDSTDIADLIYIIKNSEYFKDTRWFIAGCYNGGIAAFNFARYAPEQFREIIALPGIPSFDSIPNTWREYNILLGYGEKDSLWKNASKEAINRIKPKVKNVFLYELKNIADIIPQGYNIDSVFYDFFQRCYPEWNKKTVTELLLGEIQKDGLVLLVDEEVLKIYMAEEIAQDAFIENILIQKDEEGAYFLYGEGNKGKEFLIMKISLNKKSNKLFLSISSILEYCITKNKCPEPVFSITGKCQCSRKNAKQNIDFFRKEGFEPGEIGIGAFFM